MSLSQLDRTEVGKVGGVALSGLTMGKNAGQGWQEQGKTAVYLLRCWSEPQAAAPPLWRFRLENPRTGQHQSFADLAALFSFMADQFEPEPFKKGVL